MKKILNLLSGKKTYIIAVLIGIGALLTSLGVVIPEWIWALVGALGLGTVRAAISKLK